MTPIARGDKAGPVAVSASPGSPTVSGGFRALNPSDGLFLRAEHLAAMQDYGRELARAIGIAGGSGVVYGFTVSVDEDEQVLKVLPGLAISPIGQPLRATAPAVIALTDKLPEVGPNGFWVIEVRPAWWTEGNESVYGNLCDEPCTGSSSIEPWRIDGVTVALRPDDMPELGALDDDRFRRNWLASKYFERERQQGGPWLVPRDPSGRVESILAHAWGEGTKPPEPGGVPIGVLQRGDKGWILDVWTARRDIGPAWADSAWRSRLAMRPWNVFLAQVLQFQDQLCTFRARRRVFQIPVDEEGERATDELMEELARTPAGKWQIFAKLKEDRERRRTGDGTFVEAVELRSLAEIGIDELPPAGYFEAHIDDGLEERVGDLFGGGVDLRFRYVRADYVAAEVEEAQHSDRIPLNPENPPVAVDILVPKELADLKPLRTPEYGWAAFVRRRDAVATAAADDDVVDVRVYEGAAPYERSEVEAWVGDVLEGTEHIGELEYPAGGWAYPAGEVAAKVNDFFGHDPLVAVAFAANKDRLPLAALRATLFAASLDEGRTSTPVWSIAMLVDGREAILVARMPQIG